MPVAALVREIVQEVIDGGSTDDDFAIMLEYEARAAGLKLEPEDVAVDDGLGHGEVR
jgi:hypothetical protein